MLSLSKYLKINALLLAIHLFLFKNIASQNLIRNCSFEQHTSVPAPNNCGNFLTDWAILDSPDYYINLCIGNGVPVNSFGYCPALSGSAYMGIATKKSPTIERKEYIYQHLTSPLILGKSYYVSFFLSKSDITRIATSKIGAYFSVSQPTVAPMACLLATPQVENHSGFLTDTVNWVEISGFFIAQGGEEYITIGNFNSNADTDTLHTGTTNPFFADAGTAYYYIDSVSLYDALNVPTGISELKNEVRINLYPNPNNGTMRMDYKIEGYEKAEFKLFDITGKLVSKYDIVSNEGSLIIDEQNLNNGVYFYHILVGEKTIKTDKIVIIK